MYYYLWRSLPGSKLVRSLILITSVIAIIVILYFAIFPEVSKLVSPDTIVYR